MPKALEDAPVLCSTAREVSRAFEVLDGRRTYGFAANPIQLSEISAYIDLFGQPSMGVELFEQLLRIMDYAQLAESKPNGSTSSNS